MSENLVCRICGSGFVTNDLNRDLCENCIIKHIEKDESISASDREMLSGILRGASKSKKRVN